MQGEIGDNLNGPVNLDCWRYWSAQHHQYINVRSWHRVAASLRAVQDHLHQARALKRLEALAQYRENGLQPVVHHVIASRTCLAS